MGIHIFMPINIPIPMPMPVCKICSSSKWVQCEVCRTVLGRGKCMNITAHYSALWEYSLLLQVRPAPPNFPEKLGVLATSPGKASAAVDDQAVPQELDHGARQASEGPGLWQTKTVNKNIAINKCIILDMIIANYGNLVKCSNSHPCPGVIFCWLVCSNSIYSWRSTFLEPRSENRRE